MIKYILPVVAVTAYGLYISATFDDNVLQEEQAPESEYALAIFAGGCFWCMEPPYDKLEGVISTTSGYIGGSTEHPTYEEVSAGNTGHTEAVEIKYDPARISYAKLLEIFWKNIDPTVKGRQFCDWGNQYRTGIFYHNGEEKRMAEESKKLLVDSGKVERIVTEITAATTFYRAEEYHQDYYIKNPVRYKLYRYNCGRDERLQQLWGETG